MIQIHYNPNGTVAFGATIRFTIATLFPFWDGDAPGRAYTKKEILEKFPQKIGGKRAKKIED